MSNLIGTASTTQQLQLEALNEVIKLLIEKEAKLDARISERGSITPVSLRSFRLRFQTAFPGNVALFNLDGGILPAGNFSAWDQGTLTPLATVIPVEYSRLVDIIGEGGPKVVSENPVTKTLADVAVQMAKNRDQFLQQAGDGKIGQVDPSYAGGGANPIVLASSPWGARLISQGQQVQVMSNTYALRGTCYVNNVNNKLGAAQSITVDAVPAGTVLVSEGEKFYIPEVSGPLLAFCLQREDQAERSSSLTEREQQVLPAAIGERTAREVGKAIFRAGNRAAELAEQRTQLC